MLTSYFFCLSMVEYFLAVSKPQTIQDNAIITFTNPTCSLPYYRQHKHLH